MTSLRPNAADCARRVASPSLDQIVLSLPGSFHASLPIAAARAGAIGVLDLCYLPAERLDAALAELARLRGAAEDHRFGVMVQTRWQTLEQRIFAGVGTCDTVLLAIEGKAELAAHVRRWRTIAAQVGVVVTSADQAVAAVSGGADFLVAKGHEAGGCVGDETSLVLLQRLLGRDAKKIAVPVFAWGGIGWRSAAACAVAGAAGVVLDWQLALMREAPLSDTFRRRVGQMDGSETVAITGPAGETVRLYTQPGMTAREQLTALADQVQMGEAVTASQWHQLVGRLLVEPREQDRLWALGQDAALAPIWLRALGETPTVARALALLRERAAAAIEGAREARTLAAGSGLAASHGTEFPVAQGPMTRVSDVPEFALAVAEGGGLPFLALALMSGGQSRALLEQTEARLGRRPWGVGVLGFVERELRTEQFAAIEAVCPPYAIIAGGRPDQAAGLEAKGITTYLHVPSPGMLAMFVSEGARRFIFEGRECGGHVGPRSSFVLWELMVQVLLDANLSDEECGKVHVLFAGGIHDGLSGAMVSALAQPLVERGMKVGVLLGTAYLFTEEIVATGAILPGFQQAAVETQRTVLLETGPGHATRCADTEFYQTFQAERARLKREQTPAEVLREELENLNLGRLRIASKGITRKASVAPGESPYATVDVDAQRREGMFMIGQVAALRDGRCTIRQLHDEVCRGAVARLGEVAEEERVTIVPADKAPPTLDIAIVGMGCLMPGAHGLAAFWDNVLKKRDLVGDIPPDRFEWERWFDADRAARDKVYSRWGGFLEDVPFDPLKYGIPPTALPSIEPMQLLALALVDQVLRDAGYRDNNPYKERTSVILGAGGGIAELGAGYAVRSSLPGLIENPDERLLKNLPEWTEDSFAGILLNVVAGRISNRFDLGGVNFTVDAACASSLAAVYLACRELADGTSDMVITGGCDTLQSPFTYLCFAKAGALSPRGKSRTFDTTSDGIAISEGLAAVCLKRRADAERDGDRIYAVIRAVAGGSDGRSKGMTAPRKEGQIRTLERAYAQARFSPATVGLFEAHGTGTALGDQTECQSLSTVLSSREAPAASCAVGSLKSMVGHTKCTAGVASLIKTSLALYHRVLPPTLHVETPNAKAGLVDGALYVNSELRPWIRGEQPRRAGVSSFGFGGTNFHAVLEEYQGAALPSDALTPHAQRPAELFCFAAASPAALASRVRTLLDPLEKALTAGAKPNLAEVALTWHRRQAGGTSRAAVVAGSIEQLVERLRALVTRLGAAGEAAMPAGVHYTANPIGGDAPLAMLFPGQGSQYVNMLLPLAVEFAEVAGCFERADAALAGVYEKPLSQMVYPPPAFDDATRSRQAEELKATDVLQPALGAADVAIARLLAACGVAPAMVAGHSYGELVALHVAGVLDEASLYRLSMERGRSIVEMSSAHDRDLGRMVAVRAPEHEVRQALAGCPEVWLANINSPRQTIISGTQAGLAHAAGRLEAARLAATPIAVACGFHSPLMETARARFGAILAAQEFKTPRLDVYSNTTAERYPREAESIRQRLAEHLVRQVHFAAEIEAMYAAGARVFVEAGPGRVLSKLTSDILGARPHVVVATQATPQQGYAEFLAALAELYNQGVAIDAERLYQGREVATVDLATLAAGPKPLPKHYWLVNGSYIRPAGTPPRTLPARVMLADEGAAKAARPVANAPLPPAAGVKQAPPPAQSVASSKKPEAIAVPKSRVEVPDLEAGSPAPPVQQQPVVPVGQGYPAAGAGPVVDDVVMSEFQATMRAFLDAQEKVLTAYLTGAPQAMPAAIPVAAAPPMPVTQIETPAVAPAPASPPSIAPALPKAPKTIAAATFIGAAGPIISAPPRVPEPAAAEAPAPAPAAAPAPQPTGPPTNGRADLDELLVEIVSERTGYPSDMLSFDANLEADLGIDSIKRVEIIGAFRRAALPSLDEPPGWFMERMTSAGTLRQILEGVSQLTGADEQPATASAAPESPSAEGATPAATLVDRSQLEDMLLGVVSDRTGYPKEMLALDANLEADLGIDSIKKVEIVGAFRRAALPSVDEPPAWFMEKLSGAGTLLQILSGVEELQAEVSPGGATAKAAPAASPTAAEQAAPGEAFATPEEARELAARLEQLLVDVVSERTGYPAEMLALDANLEADLGIDSIKRVEIIGAFRRAAFPQIDEPPAWFMEEMTAAANMRAILSGVERLGGAETPAIGGNGSNGKRAHGSNGSDTNGHAKHSNGHVATKQPAPAQVTATPRCVAAVMEVPLADETRMALPGGAYVLSDDGRGLAESVAEALGELGVACEILPADVLASREATAATLSLARQRHGAIGGLVHLAPLAAAGEFPGISDSEWRARVEDELKGLLHLLQGAAADLGGAHQGSVVVLAASHGGGEFGPEAGECSRPWRGGLAGMIKTAAKEWPEARMRSIDFDMLPDAATILAELASTGPVEVGYRHTRRLSLTPLRQEFSSAAQAPVGLSRESVVLVTGGARGITAHVARSIAATAGSTLVLLGRTDLPAESPYPWAAGKSDPGELRRLLIAELRREGAMPTPKDVERELARVLADGEIRATLGQIAKAGGRAEYVACDARDSSALAGLIADVQTRLGTIDAVIHGAGVIEDRYIVDKTDESFDRVLATKLEPMLALLRLLDPRQLKLCMLFSSVSGFFGNPGQVDYAAANEVLNRMAGRLARLWPTTKVCALNWGPWSGAGMVTAEVARQFEERGVGMVTLPEGCQAVLNELACRDGATCVLYGPGPWLAEADQLAAACASVPVETPLLTGQAVHRVTDGVVEAHVTLDPARHAYLRDHMIDGKPVLPAAFALEMMAETALAAAPAGWHVTHVENLRAFSGIVLDAATRTIAVRAEAIDWQDYVGVWKTRIFEPERPQRTLYEAQVRISAVAPEVPAAPDLPRIETAFPLEVPEAYYRWLFHGPSLQPIMELRGLDASGVDAVFGGGSVELCLGLEDTSGWLIDPVVLDAAPQLGMLWSRGIHDTSHLPNRVAVYHRFGPIGAEPVEALFRVDPSSSEGAYKADVWLVRGNRVVGLMEGLEGAGTAALNRIARSASE